MKHMGQVKGRSWPIEGTTKVKAKKPIACLRCGKKFKKVNGNQKFCSRDCQRIWNGK